MRFETVELAQSAVESFHGCFFTYRGNSRRVPLSCCLSPEIRSLTKQTSNLDRRGAFDDPFLAKQNFVPGSHLELFPFLRDFRSLFAWYVFFAQWFVVKQPQETHR